MLWSGTRIVPDMLRYLIIAAFIFGIYLAARSLLVEYKDVQRKSGQEEVAAPAPITPAGGPVAEPVYFEGMPEQLEPSLQAAEAQGPATLKKWLDLNRRHLRDPRLGAIELDYAVAVSRNNPAEARQIYQAVKARTPSTSPLQPRLKRLAKTYG